jgi:hypothetical protein
MSTRSIGRRGRFLLIGAALAAALAVPSAALADTTAPPPTIYPADSRGATIALSGGSVTGRVVINTHVAFTCEPFLVFDWGTGETVEVTTGSIEFGAVTILQVSGRTINFGEGAFYGGTVVCDGSTVNERDVTVTATIVPWKTGTAVAGARVLVASPDYSTGHYASTGAVAIKLGR